MERAAVAVAKAVGGEVARGFLFGACVGVAVDALGRMAAEEAELQIELFQDWRQERVDAGPLRRRATAPFTIHMDGVGMAAMANDVQEPRSKAGGDTEKITINLGYVDLGHIDLLVQDGFYSNRTDFIRTAIRNQIERHADAAKRSVARRNLDLGLRQYSREELEAARAAGQPLAIRVLGLASIASDVSPDLARAAIARVSVLGALQASPAVRAALTDRMR